MLDFKQMIVELIEIITKWASDFLVHTGYAGVFLLSVLDRVAMNFVPAEIILPLLGFSVSQGRFDFILAIFISVVGNTIGDIILYLLSIKFGRGFLEKFGKYFLVSKHDLDHTEKLFKEHGAKLVFFGRFVPIARTFIAIPAGISRMNFEKFVLYVTLGSVPWNFILIYGGMKAGENWQQIASYINQGQNVIIVLLATGVVWYIYRHLRKKHLTHE